MHVLAEVVPVDHLQLAAHYPALAGAIRKASEGSRQAGPVGSRRGERQPRELQVVPQVGLNEIDLSSADLAVQGRAEAVGIESPHDGLVGGRSRYRQLPEGIGIQ